MVLLWLWLLTTFAVCLYAARQAEMARREIDGAREHLAALRRIHDGRS